MAPTQKWEKKFSVHIESSGNLGESDYVISEFFKLRKPKTGYSEKHSLDIKKYQNIKKTQKTCIAQERNGKKRVHIYCLS